MPNTYTSNQAAVLVLSFACSIWGITSLGAAMMIGNLPASAFMAFGILTIVSLINFIFLLKLVRPSFLVVIALWIIGVVGTLSITAPIPWYAFTNPLYDLTEAIFLLMALAGIYFGYKSYQELKK